MSNFWSWYIITIVMLNIGGCLWLLAWTRTMSDDADSDGTTGHSFDGITEYNNPLPRWWLWLFYLTIVFALGYLALYPGLGKYTGYLGWSSQGAHAQEVADYDKQYAPLYSSYYATPVEKLARDSRAMQIGNRLFENNCAACHGSDAHGARGFPNLADSDWLHGGGTTQIEETILNGRDGMMPAWGPTLGEQGVREVASYALSLSGRKVDPALAAAGQARFAMCAGCHGADGKGNQAIGAPNLTDTVWLYGGDEATVLKTITSGRQGHMPAWKDALGPERVHLLTAYIWSLSNNKR
jgi:cytochrome c oxidase cbb3-type subunit 3